MCTDGCEPDSSQPGAEIVLETVTFRGVVPVHPRVREAWEALPDEAKQLILRQLSFDLERLMHGYATEHVSA